MQKLNYNICFKKKPHNCFAENRQKSLKLVKVALTPEVDFINPFRMRHAKIFSLI
jgi:hypothetical protein